MQVVATRELTTQDIARIALAVLVRDPDGGSYCRLCSVAQNAGAKPLHEPDCPISKLIEGGR